MFCLTLNVLYNNKEETALHLFINILYYLILLKSNLLKLSMIKCLLYTLSLDIFEKRHAFKLSYFESVIL